METKRINLEVKVTYTVNIDCNVSQEELDSLEYLADEYPIGIEESDIINDNKATKAWDFLTRNCKEDDAMDYVIEIEDIQEI